MQARACDDPYWAEQGKVWVEIGAGRKRLVDLNKPRPEPNKARSDFPCPAIHSDTFLDPVQSMADGKYYDSKRSMLASYKAENNPQGENYRIVEPDELAAPPPPPQKADRKDIEVAVHNAMLANGL